MIADLPDLAAKGAQLRGSRIALEEVASGRRRTYAELDAGAARAAALLAARGIGRGDRIALLTRNRIEFFELLFGCAKIGAVLVPLNWRMPPAELDGLIADSTPALLFYDRENEASASALAAAPFSMRIEGAFDRPPTGASLERMRGATRAFWPPDQLWYILYTSGTTGRPKGVLYTCRMAMANHVSIATCIGLSSNDATLCFLPIFHTAGINLYALPTLIAGGRLLLFDGFDADVLIGLIEDRRIHVLFGVPTIFQCLIDHPRFASAPLDQIRLWGCGGAPLPDRLALRYKELGVRLCNGMGMTETGPTAFMLSPDDAWDRIGSVGKPQLLCSVRIVDGEGRDLPDGEVGDLLFAGPGVTPGYWRNEEATRAAFTPDGWLRSGDLARRDPDGFYHVVGRRKEMFISGGENVYPIEVENVLASHPAVADVAVVAAPDDHWGEVGHAFVRLAEGADRDPFMLADYCRRRLAPYKVPRHFEFVEEFPRTSAGKIRKHLLSPRPRMLAPALD